MPMKVKKAIATRSRIPPVKRFTMRQKQLYTEDESDSQYAQQMKEKKFRYVNYQHVRTVKLVKISQLMKLGDLKLKQGITQTELWSIEQEIHRLEPDISAAEAHAGAFAISNPAARRRICTKGFPNSLLQELYETNIRINLEGKLVGEKYMENVQRYDQNINARLVEPSMNL
ncbi:MAG: hypothetical protein EZS28_012674 [Streblomastix strix]|uniref:Uncharacterized protein n=1 Tax=Streblomastix strix TaxID=222440 RepID=A0A5J4WA35_9EUKA|nr:MAG: hypothetical protein EZS28_012674 [Streblomastix strix]